VPWLSGDDPVQLVDAVHRHGGEHITAGGVRLEKCRDLLDRPSRQHHRQYFVDPRVPVLGEQVVQQGRLELNTPSLRRTGAAVGPAFEMNTRGGSMRFTASLKA
jgi:hypothetical protein